MPNKKKSQIKSKKTVSKKATPKKKVVQSAAPKSSGTLKSSLGKSPKRERKGFEPEEVQSRAGGQAGALQGLSDIEDADSESVDELLEEGNAFEAEVVEGVEDAPEADKGEIRTHEVPQDDVPEEYLDIDQ